MDAETVMRADAVALADRIGALLTVVRSAEAEIGALLVEIESRGVMDLYGYRSVARLYEHLADVPKSAAERVVKRARAINPGHALDGTPVAAVAPATGAAAADGRLSTPMIDTIVDVLTQVPAAHRDDAEGHLLTFAADAGHRQVAALGTRILAHLDPDGAAPDVTEPATPARELSLRRKRSGTWELSGRFDDETGTRASALLDALAERRSSDEGPDVRSPQQRYGDAFSDALDLALNSPDVPMQAGERVHVMVAVSLSDLRSGVGTATLGDMGTMTAGEARVHACDSMVIPAVLGEKSEPLNLGRLRRVITAGLRRALYLRDRGCAFPGCHRPPRHCQGHHIRHWSDGGPTDLANLVLLCAHHHRLLHRSGWQVRMAADGLPEFVPPVFVDRRRKPPAQQPARSFAVRGVRWLGPGQARSRWLRAYTHAPTTPLLATAHNSRHRRLSPAAARAHPAAYNSTPPPAAHPPWTAAPCRSPSPATPGLPHRRRLRTRPDHRVLLQALASNTGALHRRRPRTRLRLLSPAAGSCLQYRGSAPPSAAHSLQIAERCRSPRPHRPGPRTAIGCALASDHRVLPQPLARPAEPPHSAQSAAACRNTRCPAARRRPRPRRPPSCRPARTQLLQTAAPCGALAPTARTRAATTTAAQHPAPARTPAALVHGRQQAVLPVPDHSGPRPAPPATAARKPPYPSQTAAPCRSTETSDATETRQSSTTYR